MDTPSTGGRPDPATDAFEQARPRLFGTAYRILGSVAGAEDVVQDVWLRWQGTDTQAVRNPAAFLAKATTRMAVNVARSARVRREAYVGSWLPEPVDTSVDPQVGAERREALEMAVLLMMERLNPVERAAYVLREAFAYAYDEIADILRLSQANTRQVVSRARKHLAAERRVPVDTSELRRLLDAFVAAAQSGDTAALEAVLSAGVVAHADGDGMRGVARVPVTGAGRVARINAFVRTFIPGAEFRVVDVNGLPALLVTRAGATAALVCATAGPDGIDGLYWILAPEKLRSFERSARRVR
ncbi:RNA polymerase sigma-70 factor [Streptomyces sp. G35A]